MIKKALLLSMVLGLSACSSVNILYNKDGIVEHTEITTNGKLRISIDHGKISVTTVTEPLLQQAVDQLKIK